MAKFHLYVHFHGDRLSLPVARCCSKEQLLDVLSRHLSADNVDYFRVYPIPDSETEFTEFSF